eukprot:1112880-Amphidinium_carterae.1
MLVYPPPGFVAFQTRLSVRSSFYGPHLYTPGTVPHLLTRCAKQNDGQASSQLVCNARAGVSFERTTCVCASYLHTKQDMPDSDAGDEDFESNDSPRRN